MTERKDDKDDRLETLTRLHREALHRAPFTDDVQHYREQIANGYFDVEREYLEHIAESNRMLDSSRDAGHFFRI